MDDFRSQTRFRRDHRWARARMSAYLDGELTTERRARMERHVAECPECRRLIQGLRLVIAALHRLPPAEGGRAPALAASVRLRLSGPPGP